MGELSPSRLDHEPVQLLGRGGAQRPLENPYLKSTPASGRWPFHRLDREVLLVPPAVGLERAQPGEDAVVGQAHDRHPVQGVADRRARHGPRRRRARRSPIDRSRTRTAMRVVVQHLAGPGPTIPGATGNSLIWVHRRPAPTDRGARDGGGATHQTTWRRMESAGARRTGTRRRTRRAAPGTRAPCARRSSESRRSMTASCTTNSRYGESASGPPRFAGSEHLLDERLHADEHGGEPEADEEQPGRSHGAGPGGEVLAPPPRGSWPSPSGYMRNVTASAPPNVCTTADPRRRTPPPGRCPRRSRRARCRGHQSAGSRPGS